MSYRGCGERRRKLKKLYEQTHARRKYAGGAYFNEDKHRYVKYCPYTRSRTGIAKWLRKQANKKIRRLNKSLRNSQYRKVYDYWWNLT